MRKEKSKLLITIIFLIGLFVFSLPSRKVYAINCGSGYHYCSNVDCGPPSDPGSGNPSYDCCYPKGIKCPGEEGGGGGGGGGGPTATSAPAATATPVPGATCPWSAPISISTLPSGSSGAIEGQADVIFPNNTQLLQSIYRGNQGYWRLVPVVNGNPVWASAGVWSPPYAASTLPGSGTVQTRSDFIIGNGANLVQALWRGDQGFTRTVPISGGVPQWGCTTGSPTATPPPACPKKIQGDADCDGAVNLKDYFYYVAKEAGATLPATVNVDFNKSGIVDAADRTIIVNSLLGR